MDNGDTLFLQKWEPIHKRGLGLYLLQWVIIKSIVFIGILLGMLYAYPILLDKPMAVDLPSLSVELIQNIRLYGSVGMVLFALITSFIKWHKNQDMYDILSRFTTE